MFRSTPYRILWFTIAVAAPSCVCCNLTFADPWQFAKGESKARPFVTFGSSSLRHSAEITCAVFSPSGLHIASGDMNGNICVWQNGKAPKLLATLRLSSYVSSVAFLSATQICYGNSSGVWLWNWRETSPAVMLEKSKTKEIPFIEDGVLQSYIVNLPMRYVASANELANLAWIDSCGGFAIWNATTRKTLYQRPGDYSVDSDRTPAIAIAPKSPLVAHVVDEVNILITNYLSGKPVRVLKSHANSIRSIAISKDEKYILSCSENGKILLWDFQTGKMQMELDCKGGCIGCLSEDGKRLVTASDSGLIRVYNLPDCKLKFTLAGPKEGILHVDLSCDNRTLVSVGGEEAIRRWDIVDGKEIDADSGHASSIIKLGICVQTGRLLSVGKEGLSYLWDLDRGGVHKILGKECDAEIADSTMSPSGATVISGHRDGTLCIWDAASGKKQSDTKVATEAVDYVAPSLDGRNIVYASRSGNVGLFDCEKKCTVSKVDLGGKLWSVAGSSKKMEVAIAVEGAVKILSTKNLECIATIAMDFKQVDRCCYSADGKLLGVLGFGNETCAIFDRDNNKQIVGRKQGMELLERIFGRCLCFCDNDRILAFGGDDGIIRLFDIEKRAWCKAVLAKENGGIWALAAEPNSANLFFGNRDTTIGKIQIGTNP